MDTGRLGPMDTVLLCHVSDAYTVLWSVSVWPITVYTLASSIKKCAAIDHTVFFKGYK